MWTGLTDGPETRKSPSTSFFVVVFCLWRLTEAAVRLHGERRLALSVPDLAPVVDLHRARRLDDVRDVPAAVHLRFTKTINTLKAKRSVAGRVPVSRSRRTERKTVRLSSTSMQRIIIDPSSYYGKPLLSYCPSRFARAFGTGGRSVAGSIGERRRRRRWGRSRWS